MSQGSPIREDQDDGHVRTDEQEPCNHCAGLNGHHLMGCPNMSQAGLGSAGPGDAGDEEESFADGAFDEQKVPPNERDLASNDFLWLIAKLTYEVNRVYCRSIGDHSFPEWEAAPEWQRQTNFKGVEFHFENPEATPVDSHNSWLEEKKADGWKYGPVKNPEAKEHPCFVPYNQLPPAQQFKDEFFVGICKTMFGNG